MIIYQIFEEKNHEGKYFKEWELPAGFPVPHDFILIPPTPGLKQPKFDYKTQTWIESEDDLINDLVVENSELKERVVLVENALLDLLMMKVSEA